MKRFLFLLTLFFLFSCSKDIPDTVVSSNQSADQGILSPLEDEINYARALSIAQEAPSRFAGEPTKAFFKTVRNCESIVSETFTKSGEAADTLMYVFNYAEGGYAVVPSLKVESDLIAYVEEGEFNLQDTLTDDLSAFLVMLMTDYQKSMVAKYEKERAETKASSSLTNTGQMYGPKCNDVITAAGIHFKNLGEPTQTPEYIGRKGDAYYKNNGCLMPLRYSYADEFYRGPMLTTKWGQDKPYNNRTPLISYVEDNVYKTKNAVAGCVAIAITQIMVYHAHPAKYPSNILNFNVPSELKAYVNTETALSDLRKKTSISTSAGAISYGSKFIAIIGYMLDNDWGLEETGADSHDAPKVFNNMGYASPGLYIYSGDAVESSINAGLPVYILGRRQNKLSGHAWVTDGYKIEDYNRQVYNYYFDEYGVYHGRILAGPNGGYDVRRIYFHHNFGWNGTFNGYYIDGVFDTTQIYESTGTSSSYHRKYVNIKIIPAIKKN